MPTIVSSIHSNQEHTIPELHRRVMLQHADQGNVVSRLHLLKLVVAVQLANERSAILAGFFGQRGNEAFDEVSAGVAERFSSAEISCIAFHQGGIEFVFPD
jgi:hypothetical protein